MQKLNIRCKFRFEMPKTRFEMQNLDFKSQKLDFPAFYLSGFKSICAKKNPDTVLASILAPPDLTLKLNFP